MNLCWLTYHNLDSRPWASRHRRGQSGWRGCTGQTKRHKRHRQCRLSDETATWKKRWRDVSQSLTVSQDFKVKSLWPTSTISPKSTGKENTFSRLPMSHIQLRWAAMHLDPITAHMWQLSNRWAPGIRAKDLGADWEISCHISIFHPPFPLLSLHFYTRARWKYATPLRLECWAQFEKCQHLDIDWGSCGIV